MRLRPLILSALTGCVALTACGRSSSPAPAHPHGPVAVTASAAIPNKIIQQYMNYALHFYSWVDATQSGDGTTSCSTRSTNTACTTLRTQVLRRLREERVVASFARQHGIQLSANDMTRVEHELKRLRSPHSGTARLFSSEGISPVFMRNVLQNQLLVKRVEDAVVSKAALSGPSFRLRKYVFGRDGHSYKSAIDLATAGVNDAPGHIPPIHWVAAYRLPRSVRSLMAVATSGDYVGPVLEGPSYVVYQPFARGIHRYGLPARHQIEARTFRAWLSQRMAARQSR
jgi:hypothetical protein